MEKAWEEGEGADAALYVSQVGVQKREREKERELTGVPRPLTDPR